MMISMKDTTCHMALKRQLHEVAVCLTDDGVDCNCEKQNHGDLLFCFFCFVTGIAANFRQDDEWIVHVKCGIRNPCKTRISEGKTGNNQASFACLR